MKSFFAGVAICIATYLSLIFDNQYVSSAVFAIGIYLVMMFDLELYTGYVPKIQNINKLSLHQSLDIFSGNFIGVVTTSILLRGSKLYDVVSFKASTITDIDNIQFVTCLQTMCLGIICGWIIAFIVCNENTILKYIFALPLIMTFILIDSKHCIAYMSYLVLDNYKLNTYQILYLMLIVLGNFIGGLTFSVFSKYKTNVEEG